MHLATFVEVLWHLAGVAAAVGAALFHSRTLSILLTTLHASCRKAAGFLRRGAVALFHSLHRLQELTAGETLVVLLGKERLRRGRAGGGKGKIYVRQLFWTNLASFKQTPP